MKKSIAILSLLVLPILSQAELPPAYLAVPNFKQCLAQEQTSTFTHWCLPETQPTGCPDSSWQALQTENLPDCQS